MRIKLVEEGKALLSSVKNVRLTQHAKNEIADFYDTLLGALCFMIVIIAGVVMVVGALSTLIAIAKEKTMFLTCNDVFITVCNYIFVGLVGIFFVFGTFKTFMFFKNNLIIERKDPMKIKLKPEGKQTIDELCSVFKVVFVGVLLILALAFYIAGFGLTLDVLGTHKTLLLYQHTPYMAHVVANIVFLLMTALGLLYLSYILVKFIKNNVIIEE